MTKVEYYTVDRIPNPHLGGPLDGRLYHTVRNEIVRCCRKHGPVGPMGEFPFGSGAEGFDVIRLWVDDADEDYVFFVLDDQLNDEQYIYVECHDPKLCTVDWIRDLMSSLKNHRNWGVGVTNIPAGYVLVFADRVMVTGPMFRDTKSLSDVAESAQISLASTMG